MKAMHLLSLIIICLFGSLRALPAAADDFFPAGAMSKAAGMESALRSTSAPALLYNPANLDRAKLPKGQYATYAELGYASVEQSYEHKEYDPVTVSVTTPIASVGLVAKPLNEALSFGLMIFPAKRGGAEINGMPRSLAGSMQSLAVKKNDQVLRTSLGGAYQLNDYLSFGASLVHSFESTKVEAALLSTKAAVIEQQGQNNFYRGTAGLRYDDGFMTTAAAYRSAIKKEYQGSQTVIGAKADMGRKEYAPAIWSLGIAINPEQWTFGVDANAKLWKAGAAHFAEGAVSTAAADVKDVVEYSSELAYRFAELTLGVSYAFLPSPWGDGQAVGNAGAPVPGVGFGSAEGVDRDAYGVFGRFQLMGANINTGLSRIAGSRTVAATGYNPGHYQMETVVLSGAVDYAF